MTLKRWLRQLTFTATSRDWCRLLLRWFFSFTWLRVGQGLRAESDSTGLTLEVDLPAVGRHLATNNPDAGKVRLLPWDTLDYLGHKLNGSLEVDADTGGLILAGEEPGEFVGALHYYGTGYASEKGWHPLPIGDTYLLLADADDPTPGTLADKVDNLTIEVNASHQLQVKEGGLSPNHLRLDTSPLTLVTGVTWDAASGELRLHQRPFTLGDQAGALALIPGEETVTAVLTAVACEE